MIEYESMVDDLAETVRCNRCQILMKEDRGVDAACVLNVRFPAVGWNRSCTLCGMCSMEFLEFIVPDLRDNDPIGEELIENVRSMIKGRNVNS